MKKRLLIATTLLFLVAAPVTFAVEHTWTGKISDSKCGVSHSAMEHGAKKLKDQDCTLACIKGGAKNGCVSTGKVYSIDNQEFAGLEEHAGHTVKLTGEMSADKKSIKVSKIAMGTTGAQKKPTTTRNLR